jgi:hypothetical protein
MQKIALSCQPCNLRGPARHMVHALGFADITGIEPGYHYLKNKKESIYAKFAG